MRDYSQKETNGHAPAGYTSRSASEKPSAMTCHSKPGLLRRHVKLVGCRRRVLFVAHHSHSCSATRTLTMLDQLAGRPSPSWRRSQVSPPSPASPRHLIASPASMQGDGHAQAGRQTRCRADLVSLAGLARAPVLALAVLPLAVSRSPGPLAPPLEPPPRPQVHAVADHPRYLHPLLRSQARRRPPRAAGTRTARTTLLERLLPVRPLPFPPSRRHRSRRSTHAGTIPE